MAEYAPPMRKSSLILSIFLVACGATAPAVPDAAAPAPDAGQAPETSTPVIDAAPDVDNGAPSTTYPAFNIDAPQVINVSSGPTLVNPKVVPVYFNNDDSGTTAQITTFLNTLPTSTYWGPQVKEYGVGAMTVAAPVQLTEAAPTSIDDSVIQTWLANKLTTMDPLWPQPDANTIYALFYPSSSTITLQSSTSCSSFGGYHNNIAINTTQYVAYAVVPNCGNFGGLTGINAITAPTSHELIEASTDPYPASDQAYGQVDDDHIFWMFFLGGGEVGDMCAQFSTSFYTPTDLGFAVQRTWSNAAAIAGHDPCVPADGTPYFNTMPVLNDSVSVGGQFTTKGVTIPVGQSGTVELDLFSDAPTSGPWTVSADDAAMLQGGTPTLQMSLDRTTGLNGEKLHLTINVMAASQYGAAGFIIRSQLGSRHTDWFGLVGN